jgi:hypothetical protein
VGSVPDAALVADSDVTLWADPELTHVGRCADLGRPLLRNGDIHVK